jgi:hypothetical protein
MVCQFQSRHRMSKNLELLDNNDMIILVPKKNEF